MDKYNVALAVLKGYATGEVGKVPTEAAGQSMIDCFKNAIKEINLAKATVQIDLDEINSRSADKFEVRRAKLAVQTAIEKAKHAIECKSTEMLGTVTRLMNEGQFCKACETYLTAQKTASMGVDNVPSVVEARDYLASLNSENQAQIDALEKRIEGFDAAIADVESSITAFEKATANAPILKTTKVVNTTKPPSGTGSK